MAQFLRPNSDISAGSWITSPLFSKINEASSNDSPAIESPTQTTTAFEVGLSSASSPEAGTRTLRIRARKDNTQTRGLDYNLKQGGSTVQSGTVSSDLNTGFTTYNITITATITNYSTLSLELTATGDTGGPPGNRSAGFVSWVEFQIPDAAVGATNFIQIGGDWKDISDIQVKQSGVWKSVSNVYKKIGGDWESSQ